MRREMGEWRAGEGCGRKGSSRKNENQQYINMLNGYNVR